MHQYLELVSHILNTGIQKTDRTGTGTRSIFGYQMRFDLSQGFPLLTTKKVFFDSVIRELLWFIKGATNIHDNLAQHTSIWNAWADKNGDLGPIYGYQWRNWEKFVWDESAKAYQKETIDQLKIALDMIQTQPDSRRILISAWNVADLDKMALAPCHAFFQFYVIDGRLDCQLYQRSADVALGVPFNIASYALLQIMMAQTCSLKPGFLIHTLGDAHIYLNHIEGLTAQLTRTPGPLPQVSVAQKSIFDIQFEDVQIHHYQPQPFIRFPIAV